jgi:hypothetical protein
MFSPLLFWAAFASALAGNASGWEPTHRADKGTSVDRIWAVSRTRWVAAGVEVIVTATERGTKVHRVPGLVVTNVRETPLGIFAVGSSGSVWRVNGLEIEQQVGPTRRPAPARDRDLVEDVIAGTFEGRGGVLALGTRVAFFSADGSHWQPAAGHAIDEQRKAALLGPRPAGCQRSAWLSFDGSASSGIVVCKPREPVRRLGAATPDATLEAIPRGCHSPAVASPRLDARVFMLCRPGSLWQWQQHRGWAKTDAPRGIVVVHATPTCLFAVDGTTVWRRCDQEDSKRAPS